MQARLFAVEAATLNRFASASVCCRSSGQKEIYARGCLLSKQRSETELLAKLVAVEAATRKRFAGGCFLLTQRPETDLCAGLVGAEIDLWAGWVAVEAVYITGGLFYLPCVRL